MKDGGELNDNDSEQCRIFAVNNFYECHSNSGHPKAYSSHRERERVV